MCSKCEQMELEKAKLQMLVNHLTGKIIDTIKLEEISKLSLSKPKTGQDIDIRNIMGKPAP